MLYVALILLVVATAIIGMDLANLRFAHGAGPAASVLLLLALVVLIAKLAVPRQHSPS